MTGINWRDAKTNPPTGDDLEKGRYVTVFDDLSHCGIRTAVLSQVLSDDKWCRCSEFKAHIESTINPSDSPCCSSPKEDDRPENSESYSQWVYAPLPGESDEEAAKHGRRWPTEEDGDGYIIWQWTQRTGRVRPIVGSLIDVRDDWSECSDIAWMRIPSCPPPPKRELPAIAPESFPAFVTVREGETKALVEGVNDDGSLYGRIERGDDFVRIEWRQNGSSTIPQYDIVHVGGWLTAEELESLKNGNRGDA